MGAEERILYEIASDDLKASRLLYESNLLPQSIFYLQQAVEKAIKQLGIDNKVITPNELYSKIGHKSDKIYKKLMKRISRFFEKSLDNFDSDYEEFKRTLNSQNNKDLKNSIIYGLNEWRNKEIGTGDIDRVLKLILSKDFPDYYKKFKTDENAQEIYKKKMHENLKYFRNYIKASMILFFVNMTISGSVSSARYPNEDFKNPAIIYDNKHPIVELLPILHDNIEYAIKGLVDFKF